MNECGSFKQCCCLHKGQHCANRSSYYSSLPSRLWQRSKGNSVPISLLQIGTMATTVVPSIRKRFKEVPNTNPLHMNPRYPRSFLCPTYESSSYLYVKSTGISRVSVVIIPTLEHTLHTTLPCPACKSLSNREQIWPCCVRCM